MTVNKLTKKVAEKLSAKIKEQYDWVEGQEETVTECILSDSYGGYDIRQNIQALETGKRTLSVMKAHFEDFVGMSYDKYCEDNPGATKVETPEEKLLQAIREIVHQKEA